MDSEGWLGSSSLTTASRIEVAVGIRQPQAAAARPSSRTVACTIPPLEKKRTASCVSAIRPYGLGKMPMAGVPAASQ